jgi:hypothetical protein
MIITTESKYKTISYGVYEFDIEEAWITPLEYKFKHEENYRSFTEYKEKIVQIVSILQIDNKIRNNNIPIFNDGENDESEIKTAKERVLSIFSGFENGEKIKPIVLYRKQNISECINLFKLTDGCHRLHCSIAYGFKKIPAIIYKESEIKA